LSDIESATCTSLLAPLCQAIVRLTPHRLVRPAHRPSLTLLCRAINGWALRFPAPH
jgi:inhibitor of KinA sporulation pathway (predicted exonuclease)